MTEDNRKPPQEATNWFQEFLSNRDAQVRYTPQGGVVISFPNTSSYEDVCVELLEKSKED